MSNKRNTKVVIKKSIKHMLMVFFLVTVFFASCLSQTLAYTMGSSSYRIQSDSINVGGVDVGNSASYKLQDTVGEIATGESSSTTYKLKAGYRQMQEMTISLSPPPDDVTMSPSIGGVSGGTGNGSASWTTITDNPAGYTLKIKAGTSPALKYNSYSFANYTPVGAAPDYSWSISSSDSEFGFTPEGADIVAKYKDNGIDTCATGSSTTEDKCWYGVLTSDETIAQSSSSNSPSGVATIVKFKAQSGSAHLQVEGDYTATITATATAN
jgi:hypothetical protein